MWQPKPIYRTFCEFSIDLHIESALLNKGINKLNHIAPRCIHSFHVYMDFTIWVKQLVKVKISLIIKFS